jgi:hypothetical protein
MLSPRLGLNKLKLKKKLALSRPYANPSKVLALLFLHGDRDEDFFTDKLRRGLFNFVFKQS